MSSFNTRLAGSGWSLLKTRNLYIPQPTTLDTEVYEESQYETTYSRSERLAAVPLCILLPSHQSLVGNSVNLSDNPKSYILPPSYYLERILADINKPIDGVLEMYRSQNYSDTDDEYDSVGSESDEPWRPFCCKTAENTNVTHTCCPCDCHKRYYDYGGETDNVEDEDNECFQSASDTSFTNFTDTTTYSEDEESTYYWSPEESDYYDNYDCGNVYEYPTGEICQTCGRSKYVLCTNNHNFGRAAAELIL